MALDPQFSSVAVLGTTRTGSAETNLSSPVNASTIVTGGTTGTKIEEIVIHAHNTSLAATTVAGLVYLFVFDGSLNQLFDTFLVTAITASATVAPFRLSRTYQNLILPNSSHQLKASQSIAGNASLLVVEAFGANF